MGNIDSVELMKQLDRDNYLQNIQDFPEQCERAWDDWKKIPLPARFIQAKSILISGMGGSAIGASVAAGMSTSAHVPIVVWRDYGVPGWVNKDTLVIAASYSGNTEETVDCLRKAAVKTDKLITISTGGTIEALSRKFKSTHYTINYSSQPRQAIGFQLISILSILTKLDLIEITEEDFKEAILLVRSLQKKIDVNAATGYNPSKLLAERLEGKIPIIYGAGSMAEVARRWKGHFNENSKCASYFEVMPEVNHNAMIGFDFPKDLRTKIYTIILQSKFNHPRSMMRENITLQILQRKRIPSETVMLQPAPTVISEVLQMIHFGDYTSYYLAMINGVDPSTIEMVDFLKDKLAEKPMEE